MLHWNCHSFQKRLNRAAESEEGGLYLSITGNSQAFTLVFDALCLPNLLIREIVQCQLATCDEQLPHH
jgi:hypothetical protein